MRTSNFRLRSLLLVGFGAAILLAACGSEPVEVAGSSASGAAGQVATTGPVAMPAADEPEQPALNPDPEPSAAAQPRATEAPEPATTEVPAPTESEPTDESAATDVPDSDLPSEPTEPETGDETRLAQEQPDSDPEPEPADELAATPEDFESDPERPEPVEVPAGDDGTVSTPTEPADDQDNPGGWTRLTPRNDLSGEQSATPEAVLAGPDGNTVLVRFWGGVEPCFGARFEVTESADRIEVQLITGLTPDAAVSTCIALAVAYEFEVPLSSPVGGRQILAVNFAPVPGVPDDSPPEGVVFATDYYVGLTLAEAEELAAVEGRVLRVARVDDESFALTEDYDPSRVNVEIEAGIVVAAEGW